MYRTDIRRHARTDRRNDTQSPYRHRPAAKTKSSEGGFWSFIKSWSFFGGSEDPNPETNSQQPRPERGPSVISSRINQERISAERSDSGLRIPGSYEGSIAPSLAALPNDRSLGQKAPRVGTPMMVTTTPAARQNLSQVAAAEAHKDVPSHNQNIVERQKVIELLLNSGDTPLSREEFEKINNILLAQVDSSGAVVRHSLAEATPAEKGDETTSSDNSMKAPKSLTRRSPIPAIAKADTSEDDQPLSPAVTNNGLPPFRAADLATSSPNGSVPPLSDPDMDNADKDTQRFLSQMDQNTYEIRQMLNINYDELYEPGAWEELARYKGIKYPAPPIENVEEKAEKEIDWKPHQLKDYNAGYTPAELMVNPYERISAFRGRNRKQVGFPSKKMRRNPSSLPQDLTPERKNDKASMAPPPVPDKARRTMGVISGYVRKGYSSVALPYDAEPEPRLPEDDMLTGVVGDGRRYRKILKRSSGVVYVGADGEMLDGPIEPAPKRSKFDHPEDDETTNLNKPMMVDDMIEVKIEAPLPPPQPLPKALLSRHKPDKQKKANARKKLHVIPVDTMRPRHSLHSPINPSPLRHMSKFIPDSPETPPAEVSTATTPQERAKLVTDEIPTFKFSAGANAFGKLDSLTATPAMVKAKQQAIGFKPYELPSYSLRQKIRKTRRGTELSNGGVKSASKSAGSKGKVIINGAKHASKSSVKPPQIANGSTRSSSPLKKASSPLKTVVATGSTTSIPVTAVAPPVSRGFDWAAAGLKQPVQAAGSWSCSLCSVVNKGDATKCIACETSRT